MMCGLGDDPTFGQHAVPNFARSNVYPQRALAVGIPYRAFPECEVSGGDGPGGETCGHWVLSGGAPTISRILGSCSTSEFRGIRYRSALTDIAPGVAAGAGAGARMATQLIPSSFSSASTAKPWVRI